MLFEECPARYKERYIDGVAAAPSLAMLFGKSVHTALETLLQGQGGGCPVTAAPHMDHLDCARDTYWRQFDLMRAILKDEGIEAGGLLYLEGLRMIDQVNVLSLNSDGRSQPERRLAYIPRDWPGGLPVVGAVDLWSEPSSRHGAAIWDFKTTVGSWSQERAERERWQPLLYSWAYERTYGIIPTFKYLVLNRVSGSIDIFERRWPTRLAWRDDIHDLEFAAEEIAEAILTGDFNCTRRHGTCLECGEAFSHGHVCRTPARRKVSLSRTTAQAAGSYA